jgi:hypothetical protein
MDWLVINMIPIKYNGHITYSTFDDYCKKYLVSKIYKLLPLREENKDWVTYLGNLNCELVGANEIFLTSEHFLSLINKLEGLSSVTKHEEYRAIIFDCIRMSETLPSKFKVIE